MPVGAEAAGYGGGAMAFTTGRMGAGYDAGDADLFLERSSQQQLLETVRSSSRVRDQNVRSLKPNRCLLS